MATEFESFNLPRITAGVSGQNAIAALNAPIQATEEALNALSARIGSLNSKSATVRHYVPISANTFVGALVYYNSEAGKGYFEPAIARLLGEPGTNGASVEAPESRVEGIIISKDASGITGTMLCGGYWESSAVVQSCLGTNATAGTYYLSPYTAGKAVLSPNGHLRQPVLSYYGNGKFNLNMFYMAHDNHFHGSAVLVQAWESASSVSATPPANAKWVYNGATDNGYVNLGELTKATTAVFHEGILQAPDGDFVVSDGYVWCRLASAPQAGSVTIFNHYPFAYDSPVVRGVESTQSSLIVRNRNGLIQLTPNSFISGDVNKNALAVSAISDNVVLFTPVVTEVIGGPGISLADALNGSVVISSSQNIGMPKDAYSINHNGTAITSDGRFQYITFPSNRISEFVMYMPVSDVPEGNTLKAQAWGTLAGKGADFNVDMYVIKEPMKNGETFTLPTEGVSTELKFIDPKGGLTYSESAGTVEFSQPVTLVAVVRLATTNSADIRMMRAGFKVNIKEASNVQDTTSGQLERTMAVTGTHIAGYSVSKYDLVFIRDGKLQKCMSADAASGNLCIGVAIMNATVDDDTDYIITGILQDPAFNLIPGSPVYVGLDGRMTQTDPSVSNSAMYVQKIGMALTSAAIQINIEPAVMLGI